MLVAGTGLGIILISVSVSVSVSGSVLAGASDQESGIAVGPEHHR